MHIIQLICNAYLCKIKRSKNRNSIQWKHDAMILLPHWKHQLELVQTTDSTLLWRPIQNLIPHVEVTTYITMIPKMFRNRKSSQTVSVVQCRCWTNFYFKTFMRNSSKSNIKTYSWWEIFSSISSMPCPVSIYFLMKNLPRDHLENIPSH